MGVKDLWNILSPLCDRKPMFELQGKTVAIDMSCWLVDSQTITDHSAQPKMYLRNLFFRTAFLLMQGVSPVFVLEGKAPTLKHNTIAKRNDIRSGFRERKTNPKGTRTHFKRILNECKEMLEYMGLACIQGYGEAEAMCAYLNEDGLVDGCISQDSDCFLYGAKVVYRNFCVSAQGNRGGSNGAVDEYNLEKIEKILEIGRNKMIALALLCGCDYNEGINGVGKEAALKLFKVVKDEDILDRIKSWRTDNTFDLRETELLNPNLCSSCGHSGKVQKHARSGCTDCGTVVKCNDSYREKRTLLLNEITLRKKSLAVEDFPSQELIDEFLVRRDPVPTKVDIQWKQPRINKFIDFVERHLSWEPLYAFEKIFPLVTRWQLVHLPNVPLETRLTMSDLFVPEVIKKIRNIRSVASYEIIWRSDHETVDRLREYLELEKENDTEEETEVLSVLASIEPQHAVRKCYPELVEAFEDARNAKTKKRRGKSKVESVAAAEAAKKPRAEKRRQKKNSKVSGLQNNRKIDEFVSKNAAGSLEESFERLSITPKRCRLPEGVRENKNRNERIKLGPQFDRVLKLENVNRKLNNTLDRMFHELSPDDFASDGDDLNMSEIIENICSQKVFRYDFPGDTQTPKCENLGKVEHTVDNEAGAVCDKSVDEFANIDESYVPLNQRIVIPKGKEGQLRKISTETSSRCSFGLDALMSDSEPEAGFPT